MKLRLPLNLRAALLAAVAFVSFANSSSAANTGNSISINFGHSYDLQKEELLVGATGVAIAGKLWNLTNAHSGQTGNLKNSKGELSGVSTSWGTHFWRLNSWVGNPSNANKQMMDSYIDWGGAPSTFENIEYLFYDVYIYTTTQNAAETSKAKKVNGVNYTYKNGKLTVGNEGWGANASRTDLIEGQNYMKVSTFGSTLTVTSDGMSGTWTNTSGIQIVETDYSGVYEETSLTNGNAKNWMAKGDNSPWIIKEAKADWKDSTGTGGDDNSHIAKISVTGTAGLSLKDGETAIMDGLYVDGGGVLNINNGTVKLINHTYVNVDGANTVLNLNTTLTAEKDIRFLGTGLVVLKKDQTWTNIYGVKDFRLQNDANLPLTGDAINTNGVILTGSGNLHMNGNGTLRLSQGSSLTGEGEIYANSGTVIFSSVDWFTGDLSKKIDLASKGTVAFDATADNIHALAPMIGKGNVKMGFYNPGGTSGGDLGMALDLSKTNYSNEIILKGGLLNTETSNLINSEGKKDFVIVLDGGGIIHTTKVAEQVTFANDIVVGAGGGFLRDYNKYSSLYTGKISGSGQLSHVDGGTMTLAGDLSEFTGEFWQNEGSVVFAARTVANIKNYRMFSPGGSKAGSVTILGKMTVAQDCIGGGVWNSTDTPTLNIGDDKNTPSELTVNRLLFFRSMGAHTINLKSGVLNILGTGNEAFCLGDWAYTQGFFNQSGGTLNIVNENIRIVSNDYNGKDSHKAIWKMSNGTANVKGISFAEHINHTNRRGELYFTGGRINIGSYGIDALTAAAVVEDKTDYKFEAGGATFGALDSWTSRMAMELTGVIVFDTRAYVADGSTPGFSGGFHTITWDASLSDVKVKEGEAKVIGSIEKVGAGTLVLSKDNTFTGGVTLKGGNLSIGAINALGKADHRNLKVEGKGTLISSLSDKIIDKLNLTIGSRLTLDAPTGAMNLNIGTYEGNGSLVMDLFKDGSSDNVTIATLTAGSAFNLNLILESGSVGKTYTLLKGVSGANLDMISFDAGYRDTLTLTESLDNGNYKIAVGGSITSKTVTWNGNAATGTWKLKDAASWDSGSGGYYQADDVVFGAPGTVDANNNQVVTLDGILAPNSVKVTTSAGHNYVFTSGAGSGSYLTGGMSLTKEGEGTLLIKTGDVSTYSGKTTVNGGVLEFAAGSFSGKGEMAIGEQCTLMIHEMLPNTIAANGTLAFAFSGNITKDLGTLSNVTWGTNSTLAIASGAVKGDKAMFSGKTISVFDGGAFDLSGQDRSAKQFELVLAGKGVLLLDGTYTGALFNSGGSLSGKQGIKKLSLAADAMLVVGGGNASGAFTDGSRYEIYNELVFNTHTLSKRGQGMFDIKAGSGSASVDGKLIIEEGFVLLEGDNFGTKTASTSIEIKRGAGWTSWGNGKNIYADIQLDSSATDLTKGYINNRNWATLSSASGDYANFWGNVTLNNGGVIMVGGAYNPSTTGANISLLGTLKGKGTLYVDQSVSTASDRCLYLGAEISGIDGIEMIGRSDTSVVFTLQLGTHGLYDAVEKKNATIADGLKITGGRDAVVKIVASGQNASYKGLNFQIAELQSEGMLLRVDRQSSEDVNNFRTTLIDATGTVQQLALGVGGKLALSGATDLTLNTNLAIAGEKALFSMEGGKLTVKKEVTVETSSQMKFSGGGNMTVGGNFSLNGSASKLMMGGGSLSVTGNLLMAGASSMELLDANARIVVDGDFNMNAQGATLLLSAGQVEVKNTFNIGGDGWKNYSVVTQEGGTLKSKNVILAVWDNGKSNWSEYLLKGGELNVTSELRTNDGRGRVTISGGTANIEKYNLNIGPNAGADGANGLKGAELLLQGGRLNIGGGGIIAGGGDNAFKKVILSGGTLGALGNRWSTSVELTLKNDAGKPDGFVVDTTTVGQTTGAEIIWSGAVKNHAEGGSKFSVAGVGTLELSGVNDFTGDITLTDSSTLKLSSTGGLKSKVIIQDSAIFRMGANDLKTTNAFEVQSGQILLDKTGVGIGAVTLNGDSAKLDMTVSGVSTGAVTLESGAVNVSANATVGTLSASGGSLNISAGILTSGNSNLALTDSATLKFTGNGNVATGTIVSTTGDNAVIELGNLKKASEESLAYTFTLKGNGKLVVKDAAAQSSFNGVAGEFNGKVDVQAGQLTLGATTSMGAQSTALVAGHLVFAGATEQVATITGAGKVSFNNQLVNITKATLFSGFSGNLYIESDQKVTFTGTGLTGTPLLGANMSVEFGGNSSGILALNNTHETVHDVILTSSGSIQLRGASVTAVLDGISWLGNGTEQSKLTLDVGTNKIYVKDKTLTDVQLDRLWMITDQGHGGVVLDTDTGELKLDQSIELRVSSVYAPAQSYQLTEDHSASGNRHTLDGNTSIRSLTIVASATNSELLLLPNVKLGLKQGRLTISNKPGEKVPYTINGGSIGMLSAINPLDTLSSQLSIYQDAAGLVTISSTIDDTVFLLSKKGTGDLVLSGTLQNKGGVLVEGGSLTLTGTSVNAAGTLLKNNAKLTLGDGKKAYQVNYSGLESATGSTTTFSALSVINSGFTVKNAGTLNLLMGTSTRFDKAFTGAGTAVIGNRTEVILPQGSVQNFTVEKDSTLTMELSTAASSGKVMKGEGNVVLKNTSGTTLDLSGVETGTSWSGFTGKLIMSSNQAMTMNLGLMGVGASLEVSKGGRVNDIGTETTARDYKVTLGDEATWSLANGVSYKGTLALGSTGTLMQTGNTVMNAIITGGQLNVQDGHLTLSGNNTHQVTNVGANTTVTGTSAGAFGKSLQLMAQGAQAQIDGEVKTGALIVADVAGLELKSGSLTVSGRTEFNGTLSGAGDLNLQDNSILGGAVSGDIAGITVNIMKGELTLTSDLGTAKVNVAAGARVVISGNAGLSDNTITLGAGSSMTGGSDFNGILNVVGNGTNVPLAATVNGGLNVQSLHLMDPTAGLDVNGSINVRNGGSFLLSDANTQGTLGGAIVKSTGTIELSGIFDVDLNVNESFMNNEETITFQLFKGAGGLNVNLPETEHVNLAIDETIREFFTLDQSTFTSNGIIKLKRQEMVCVLLDPSNTATGGSHENGHIAGNANTYLGANKNNNGTTYPDVFFYDKSYTIAQGDNAYRLTSGEAWMNFHVAMTDQQLNAATKVVIRRMEKAGEMPTNAGGVILSMRGNADNTYSGGTQIYQAKVKVDGSLNEAGTGTVSEGDVYFFGTGRVEATGNEAAIILNTGGNGSKGTYTFANDFLLQQGAVLEQTSSSNVILGNLTTKGVATIRNITDNDLTLSGSRLNGDILHIQGAEGKTGAVTLEGVTGEKVNAKFTTVDVNNSGHLSVGRNATTNITSLYLDKGSSLTMTEGGVFGVKEMKNGSNGAGDVYLSGGTFKLLSDMALTENGAKYHVTSSSTYDTNGYYLEVNQYLTGWSDFTVMGGGTMLLLKDLSSFDAHATITGNSTKVTISKDKTLAGSWTVKDGGTLRTEENVSIRGTLNMEKGGSTEFGLGTKLDMATLNFKDGSTYSGFLKGDGSTVNFEGGSHFQIRTEDLRKLTDTGEKALLSSGEVKISNGKGFFNFSGGDGVVNDALLDSEKEKTLIIGSESLTVGGLGTAETVDASELTGEQLAAMVGETNYRWLSFVLTSDKVGETGSKINVTVTRNVNFSELAETSNEIAIAPTLSYIGMEGGKVDSKLLGEELNMLGLALTKATGDAHQMLSNISLSTSSIMAGYSVQRENLRRHTLELRDRAVQERPCALRNQYETLENTVWASGQGGTYSVDGDNNAVGHTTSLWGGQLGVSRCVNDNLVLGLAFTYTSSDINLDQGMGKATNDAYYIDLYAKYHKDNWNVTGILTGGFTDLETERNMSIEGFSSRTKGSSSGNQLMGMVEVGYEIDLEGDRSNIIEPFAALTAGYSSIDGFEETGAGTAGLNVASQSDTSCSIGAGVRYVKEFSTSSDELLRGRFEVRAMILQDLTDNEVDVEARFIGANGHSFSQKSTEIGKTGFLLGTGVVVPTSANMSFFADLNGEFRSSETGCNANIGVKYNF